MSKNNDAIIRDSILDAIEASLEAQLRAVRRLRNSGKESEPVRQRGLSHIDMAYDILNRAGVPLHSSQIIKGIEDVFSIKVDRESLCSAIVKKVHREDRFIKTGKNTYTIKKEGA